MSSSAPIRPRRASRSESFVKPEMSTKQSEPSTSCHGPSIGSHSAAIRDTNRVGSIESRSASLAVATTYSRSRECYAASPRPPPWLTPIRDLPRRTAHEARAGHVGDLLGTDGTEAAFTSPRCPRTISRSCLAYSPAVAVCPSPSNGAGSLRPVPRRARVPAARSCRSRRRRRSNSRPPPCRMPMSATSPAGRVLDASRSHVARSISSSASDV